METLRILQLNSMLLGGGTDDQCEKLALGLLELNQEVAVIGPARREYSDRIRKSGIPFLEAPTPKPAFILRTAKVIRDRKIQVVHGHHGRDLWPTVLAAKLSGMRPVVVLTRHMAKSPSSWLSRRFLLNQCDALIAVSEFVAIVIKSGVREPNSLELERRWRPPLQGDHSKIRVIYGGIDTNRFRPFDATAQREAWNLKPQHFAFGIVGGFYAPGGKGQNQFLTAAARIHQQIPTARFLIVGRGDMETELNQQIKALGLHGKAWLAGYCSEMEKGMNALDCVAHPVVGTEALGLVVCEAMACGKPVIASDLDGLPEAINLGGYGKLVPPRSIEELAEAMVFWATQPKPARAFKELLHSRITERFSYQKMASNVLGLYTNLLQNCS